MKQKFHVKFLQGSRGKIIALSALGVGSSACGVFLAVLSKSVIDLATGQAAGNLLYTGVFLGLVILLQLGLQIVLTVLHVHTTTKLRFRMQAFLFERFFQKSKIEADRFHSGELVNRLSGDTGIVANGIAEIFPSLLSISARLIFSFAALLFLDWALSLLCVLAGIIMLIAAYFYRRKTGDLFRQSRECEGKLRSFIQESAQNFAVIRAFSVRSVILRLLGRTQDESYALTIKTNRISIGANVCFSVAMTAAYYAVLAWGAWRIHTGAITFGTLTAVLGLAAELSTPFQQLASLFPQYMAFSASVSRLEELEELPEDEGEIQKDPGNLYEKLTAICVRDLEFSYTETMVLSDANAIFDKGKITAVTGASGAGKSTLLNLVIGLLLPKTGGIFAKTVGGEEISLAPYRKLFAYVPQDFLLLSGDVLQNITFFEEEPDMERVRHVLHIAQLEDVIAQLPNGLQTQLGEGGSRLSGGQRQRMAIARALYSPAEILLMDESTSALTADLEEVILQSLHDLGKTVIFVTHRKTAVDLCDAEYRVEHGKVTRLR